MTPERIMQLAGSKWPIASAFTYDIVAFAQAILKESNRIASQSPKTVI